MAKTLAIIFGVVFVLVGILGFIQNPIVGMDGIFVTNHAHDLVHLLFGVILLVVAFVAAARAGLWMIILGVIYLVLAVVGFVMVPHGGNLLGFVATNDADHWLHIVLGVVLIVLGIVAKGKKPAAMAAPAPAAPQAPAGPSM
jgi:hypothetical protein